MFHMYLLAQHMKDLGNPTFPRIIMKPKLGNWHLQALVRRLWAWLLEA